MAEKHTYTQADLDFFQSEADYARRKAKAMIVDWLFEYADENTNDLDLGWAIDFLRDELAAWAIEKPR
jgi:hypothetical protein